MKREHAIQLYEEMSQNTKKITISETHHQMQHIDKIYETKYRVSCNFIFDFNKNLM